MLFRSLLEGVVMLQQRIKNEDMGARWRGEGTKSMNAVPASRKPIVVGGGPIE